MLWWWLFHVAAVSNYPFLKYLWSFEVTLLVALTYELVVSWPTLLISASDFCDGLCSCQQIVFDDLTSYIHCYSQTHFVSSLICSLSRASRKFYVLIKSIHLCKDCFCVVQSGGLLLLPPDLQQSLMCRHQGAWVVNRCVPLAHPGKHLLHHLWPLWPWQQSGTFCEVWKKGSVSLVILRVLVMPKAPKRCPQKKPVHTPCLFGDFFCHFLTLIFTIILRLCLHHNVLSYETCSIYSIFHNSCFCRNCTQTAFTTELLWQCQPYLWAWLCKTAPKNIHSGLHQLSVKLGHFSHSSSLNTCDTQQSLTAPSTIQQVSHT